MKTKSKNYSWQERTRKIIKDEFGGELAFCEKIEKTQSWLNGKMHNRRKCTYEDILVIAEGLNLSPTELLASPDEYIIIQRDPQKAKASLISQVQEIAAEYVAEGRESELQEISDLMSGRLNRIKDKKDN